MNNQRFAVVKSGIIYHQPPQSESTEDGVAATWPTRAEAVAFAARNSRTFSVSYTVIALDVLMDAAEDPQIEAFAEERVKTISGAWVEHSDGRVRILVPTEPQVPEGVATGSAHIVFRATLTETSNEYLKPRLPLTGYIKIVEFSTTGEIQPHGAYFMPDAPDGSHTSFVRVEDARFEIGTR